VTNPANPANPEDPIANAIIDNAFASDDFKSPLSSPSSKMTNAPNAPKKQTVKAGQSKSKQSGQSGQSGQSKSKQSGQSNYNIIIHVEPRSDAEPNDISKRLDFGSKAANDVNAKTMSRATAAASSSSKAKPTAATTAFDHDDDDSDEDYIPGCSDSDSSWDTYEDDDEYDEDDDYYDDDDDSDSSSSDSSDDNTEELEELQQKHTAEMKMLQSLRATYEELLAKDKGNRIVAKQLKTLKESEEKIKQELDALTHRQKHKNSKKFRKLLRRKSSTNDLEYFKKHLTLPEQRAMIAEMDAVAKVTEIVKPYKLTLLESDIPRDMKAVALRKVGMLQYMEPGCGEYCKLKNWVDAFMQIPFNRHKNLPITIADGVDCCHEFMTSAKTRLDAAVYGLNDAKMQIMQMVGQWIANPAAIGTAVAIHGPPGTGKTSLVKEGISKILGRDFEFIALGGATDSSFLEGHSYTYEGSVWGKIVDILMRCKSSNPVIYFDELDKISETSKGDEIVGILTHLTDTSQNSEFHDKYFSEVAFDLSKCLFIFSYNDESRVNPVLLDRMYKIRTTGYGTKDKTFIAQNYLIPRIRTEVAFAEGDIIIPASVVEYIVENYTQKEAGVRNLKRCLETVYTKLNLHRLMRPGTQLFDEKEKSFEVTFPYTVNRDVVDKLIKKNDDRPSMNLYL
jgi:ATP-dependent Lon protease